MTESLYDHARLALDAWGIWARRPQMWVPLRGVGMYRCLPIGGSRPPPEAEFDSWPLDPQSQRINVAVLGLDELHAAVLWATYVRLRSWQQVESVFAPLGLDADGFADLLRHATVMAWVRAQESEMAYEGARR